MHVGGYTNGQIKGWGATCTNTKSKCMCWGWINVSWKLFATVAIMHLYLRYILLSFALEVVALCQGFGKKKKKKKLTGFLKVYSVFLGLHFHSALQFFKCVWGVCTHVVYIHKAHFPSSPCLTFFTGLTNWLTDGQSDCLTPSWICAQGNKQNSPS